mmetsp:Transcript_7764/g.23331  ORF Transcript_7764/g.23331 Transcript_7764/m.23331 type:complete len:147 (-) Transcript_7764:1415-1855(-)
MHPVCAPYAPVMRHAPAVAVLCELELIIKRNLISLGRVSFSDPDDFDVLLSDYFDLIAGTSAGTYVMTYLGTDGGNLSSMRDIGVDTAVPGSAYGAFQFMRVCAGMQAVIELEMSGARNRNLQFVFATIVSAPWWWAIIIDQASPT